MKIRREPKAVITVRREAARMFDLDFRACPIHRNLHHAARAVHYDKSARLLDVFSLRSG